MFIEMIESTFHGIYRDIGDAVKTYTKKHIIHDYAVLDQIVVETFHMTEKPNEVPQKLWDELLETFRIGIEVGLCMNGKVDDVMRAVIARAGRHVGERIIARQDPPDSRDPWANLIHEGRVKIIGTTDNGKKIYQAI
jgi:hypothetical protein